MAPTKTLRPEGTEITVARSKVLGMLWDDENDEFIFNFKEVLEIANNFNITKWNVLRTPSAFLRSTKIHSAGCDQHENLFSKAVLKS